MFFSSPKLPADVFPIFKNLVDNTIGAKEAGPSVQFAIDITEIFTDELLPEMMAITTRSQKKDFYNGLMAEIPVLKREYDADPDKLGKSAHLLASAFIVGARILDDQKALARLKDIASPCFELVKYKSMLK